MLRCISAEEPHSFPVTLRSTNQEVYVVLDTEGELHVNQVKSYSEVTIRILDKLARDAFQNIEFRKAAIHVLQNAAGGGKTTCLVSLARNLILKDPIVQILILTFNKNIQKEGASKTEGEKNIVWKTIDSVARSLFKDQIEGEPVKLSDCESIRIMAEKVLQTPVSIKEVEAFQKDLEYACDQGDISALSGTALLLYEAAMRLEWFSFSTLRILALGSPKWEEAMAKFGVIMVDESQDMNRVLVKLIAKLHSSHMCVYSRDISQKIYSFAGNVDIVSTLSVPYHSWETYLTFRYGKSVCDLVNSLELSRLPTFPARGVRDTGVFRVGDDEIVKGEHTVLTTTWHSVLKIARSALRAGRNVYIDAEKREHLLQAATGTGWSEYDGGLFKRMSKKEIIDILKRTNVEGAQDVICVTTVHSRKGQEIKRVRVCPLVMKKLAGRAESDRELVYVAITRAVDELYLPLQNNKRKR